MTGSASPYSDEKLFYSVIEASPAGMLIVDDEGIIVLANRTAGEQFGFPPSELHNQPIEILIPDSFRRAHTTHRARYMSQPQHRPMATGRNLYARRKDGSEFQVDVSLHPIEVQQRQMVLANVLDATDRRRAEQEREQRQAMERLAMMGQLAGGVAHEIRTPLCVIRNDAYFLKTMADKLGDEGLECVIEIDQAVSKAERIISELLDFTRDPQSEQSHVEIGRLIDESIRAVGVPSATLLRRRVEDETTRVCVDPEQIERVIINLVRNASQATSETGCVQIRTAIEGNLLLLEVIDDGPGIAPEFLERVFEPLFTTKPKGIGLGLAVSQQYAVRNGGTLTARNADDGGAVFRLTLPLATAPARQQD